MKQQNRSTRLAILLFAATTIVFAYPAHSQSLTNQDKEALTKILKENETKPPSEALLAQIQALVDKYPKDYYARLVMGNTLDRVGMPMQAIEQYQIAVQYGPNSPQAIIELVKAQIGVGQKEAAMRLLQEADKRFPNDREIAFWMGNYYLAKGDLKQAQQKFRQVQSSGQPFFGMGTAQGEIQMRCGRPELAIILVENDLVKNPQYPLANALKGEALFSMRRYKEAQPYLKKAFASFPFRQGFAREYAASCVATNDFQAALEPAMVALASASKASEPDHETQLILVHAISHLPHKYVQEQVPILSEKIDKIVSNPRWHFTAGELFDFYSYHDLAAAQFYRAYQIDPTEALAAYRLAIDLEMYFQKYEEARNYLAQAHALSPSNTDISDRLERLQNRLAGRNADLAWQLKDFLRKQASPI